MVPLDIIDTEVFQDLVDLGRMNEFGYRLDLFSFAVEQNCFDNDSGVFTL